MRNSHLHGPHDVLLTVTSETRLRRAMRRALVTTVAAGAAAAIILEAVDAPATSSDAARYASETGTAVTATCASWPTMGTAQRAEVVDYLAVTWRQAHAAGQADYSPAPTDVRSQIEAHVETACRNAEQADPGARVAGATMTNLVRNGDASAQLVLGAHEIVR